MFGGASISKPDYPLQSVFSDLPLHLPPKNSTVLPVSSSYCHFPNFYTMVKYLNGKTIAFFYLRYGWGINLLLNRIVIFAQIIE